MGTPHPSPSVQPTKKNYKPHLQNRGPLGPCTVSADTSVPPPLGGWVGFTKFSELSEPRSEVSNTVQTVHHSAAHHTHTQRIVCLARQNPPHVHRRLPATLVTPFMSELQDKFCLAPAGTHRHACWCTCVPIPFFFETARKPRAAPATSAAEGWGPPTPPQLTLPTRTSPRPVDPPLPHGRPPSPRTAEAPSVGLTTRPPGPPPQGPA